MYGATTHRKREALHSWLQRPPLILSILSRFCYFRLLYMSPALRSMKDPQPTIDGADNPDFDTLDKALAKLAENISADEKTLGEMDSDLPYLYTHFRIYKHTHSFTHSHVHARMHSLTRTCAYIHIYIHTYLLTYLYTSCSPHFSEEY